MLLNSIIVAIILLTVSVVVVFFRKFLIIRINGESMLPTFKHGQYRIVDKRYNAENIGDLTVAEELTDRVFIIWSPDGLPIVKRLTYISRTKVFNYWFEGDNPEKSMDSRQYGFLEEEGFVGEVVGFKEAMKRLI